MYVPQWINNTLFIWNLKCVEYTAAPGLFRNLFFRWLFPFCMPCLRLQPDSSTPFCNSALVVLLVLYHDQAFTWTTKKDSLYSALLFCCQLPSLCLRLLWAENCCLPILFNFVPLSPVDTPAHAKPCLRSVFVSSLSEQKWYVAPCVLIHSQQNFTFSWQQPSNDNV